MVTVMPLYPKSIQKCSIDKCTRPGFVQTKAAFFCEPCLEKQNPSPFPPLKAAFSEDTASLGTFRDYTKNKQRSGPDGGPVPAALGSSWLLWPCQSLAGRAPASSLPATILVSLLTFGNYVPHVLGVLVLNLCM